MMHMFCINISAIDNQMSNDKATTMFYLKSGTFTLISCNNQTLFTLSHIVGTPPPPPPYSRGGLGPSKN